MDKPDALRLADRLESDFIRSQTMLDAAAELRRLHEENDLLASAADKLRITFRDERMELLRQRDQATAQRITFRDERMELLRQRDQATAQRDALLEALKRMASIIEKMGDMPDEFIHPSPWRTLKCAEALTQADAAIKAVEETK